MSKTKPALAALAALAFAAAPALAQEAAPKAPANSPKPAARSPKPKVEVVFVLDTTGSMSGLIRAAKERIWDITNVLAQTKPTPDIKLGLVAFRDRGDAYITRRSALSDDLDAIYKELMGFEAGGGGDGPESVNQALNEAVSKFNWSPGDEAFKVIFLVGDAPPHMDYKQDVVYTDSCKLAAEKGIVVNTIQCGGNGATRPHWESIARLGKGEYIAIAQSGGAVVPETPFDKELSDLSQALDRSRVYYGSNEYLKKQAKRQKVADDIDKEASVSARAQRGCFNQGKSGYLNWARGQELITDLEDGRVKLADLKKETLPKELKAMSDKELEAYVAKKLAERKQLRERLKSLAAKRGAFLKEYRAKHKTKGKADFDEVVSRCLKRR